MTKSSLTNRGKEEPLTILGKGFREPHALMLRFYPLLFALKITFVSFCLDFVFLDPISSQMFDCKVCGLFRFLKLCVFVASLFLCAPTVS